MVHYFCYRIGPGVALGLIWLCVVSVSAFAQRKPNIIFVMADDLGYGDVGAFGQRKIKTPSLDRMAAEDIKLTQFYAGSPVCAPSRCVLMTGLHTGHARVRKNDQGLLDEDVTAAEVLKQAGYTTALIGKWGLGDPGQPGVPWKQGFDYFYGFLNQKHAQLHYPSHLYRNEEVVPLLRGEYAHDLFTEEALELIRREKEKPFFLYLAYTIPHANSDLARATKNGMQVPSDAPYENQNWPQVEKSKAAMIRRMDRDIGRLLDLLKQLRLDGETIIFFTSDNGPSSAHSGEPGVDIEFLDSNGPLRGGKRDLYEGGIRVPLIVRWKGRIAAGGTSEQVSAMWDFLPTVAELAGVKVTHPVDGISLLPALLVGKQQTPHKYLYWEYGEGSRKMAQAVRMGDWKAVRTEPGAPLALYDLKRDIGETTDLAAQHPDIVKQMEEIIAGARVDVAAPVKARTTP